MKTELLFYTTGAFFILGAILYFTQNDLFYLTNTLKSIILFAFTILFFVIGVYLKERDL